jgi:hypothetical protein
MQGCRRDSSFFPRHRWPLYELLWDGIKIQIALSLGSVRLDQKMREPVLNQEPEPEPEPNLEPFPELVRRMVHLVQVQAHRLFNPYRDSSRHTRRIITFLPNPRIPSWCPALLSYLRPLGEPSAEPGQICGKSD